MDNPVTVVKNNVSVGKILGFVLVGLVVFAALDFFNLTNWLMYPVTSVKGLLAARRNAAKA